MSVEVEVPSNSGAVGYVVESTARDLINHSLHEGRRYTSFVIYHQILDREVFRTLRTELKDHGFFYFGGD